MIIGQYQLWRDTGQSTVDVEACVRTRHQYGHEPQDRHGDRGDSVTQVDGRQIKAGIMESMANSSILHSDSSAVVVSKWRDLHTSMAHNVPVTGQPQL